MSNYVNKFTILGMTPANGSIEENKIYKTKKKNKVIVFDKDYIGDEDEINYAYIEELPDKKINSFKLTEVKSLFDNDYFTNNKHKDIKETVKKYSTITNPNYLNVCTEPLMGIDEVLNMIHDWQYTQGWKYGFNEHAGYDKKFFKEFYEKYKDNLNSLFFYHKNKLIGYSVIEKNPSELINNIPEYKYLIRKYVLGYRNLCKYIDYYTFKYIYDKQMIGKFIVNWGASSGGVLQYKTNETWFPIYLTENRYFWKIKK